MVSSQTINLPNWLGKIIDVMDQYSYTFYLMHGVVFCSLLDRLNALGVSKIIIAVTAIFASVLLTFVVGKFIEKPIQSFLKKRFVKS